MLLSFTNIEFIVVAMVPNTLKYCDCFACFIFAVAGDILRDIFKWASSFLPDLIEVLKGERSQFTVNLKFSKFNLPIPLKIRYNLAKLVDFLSIAIKFKFV